MERVTEVKAINSIVGTSFTVDGKIYSKHHCLLIYSKHCDDYSVEPDKKIHEKTAEEIFTECHKIYVENN